MQLIKPEFCTFQFSQLNQGERLKEARLASPGRFIFCTYSIARWSVAIKKKNPTPPQKKKKKKKKKTPVNTTNLILQRCLLK